jgi:glycerol-3-phosphate dehydrogenase (NAD(P)+)
MKITVMGDGAWGRALAGVARQAGHEVSVWTRRSLQPLKSDVTIIAVPAQALHDVLVHINAQTIISAAKGIDRASGLTMAQLVNAKVADADYYVLSGPSFAADVVEGLPTAVTLAGADLRSAEKLASELSIPAFRIYASDDVIGVEIGGALKNVLAIACGISDGRKLGESARASLITRGFAELTRYGRKLGAKPETLMGLSGLGDLLLTCSSKKSRNYSFGLALGNGFSVQQAMENSSGVVEGALTAQVAAKLAAEHGVEMPIVKAVNSIIDGRSNPDDEIAKLLARPTGAELK